MAAGIEKWIGPSRIADNLGVDVRHVHRLGDQGVLRWRAGKRGREYAWPEGASSYLEYQISQRIGTGQGTVVKMSLDEERAALLRVQRKREEIKLELDQKNLVPATYMRQQNEQLLARLASVARTWSEQWTTTLRARGLDAQSAELLLQLQEDALLAGIYAAVADADPEQDDDVLEDAA